eukprot:44569-Pelagomonas_calceolata.AAC.1
MTQASQAWWTAAAAANKWKFKVDERQGKGSCAVTSLPRPELPLQELASPRMSFLACSGRLTLCTMPMRIHTPGLPLQISMCGSPLSVNHHPSLTGEGKGRCVVASKAPFLFKGARLGGSKAGSTLPSNSGGRQQACCNTAAHTHTLIHTCTTACCADVLQAPLANRLPKVLETHGDQRVDEYYWCDENCQGPIF